MVSQPFIYIFILVGGLQGLLLGLIHVLRPSPFYWTRLLGWTLATHALSDVFLWAFWTRSTIDLRLLTLLPLNVVLVPVFFLLRYIRAFTQSDRHWVRYIRFLAISTSVEVVLYLLPAGAAFYTGRIDDSVLAFAKAIRNALTIGTIPVVISTCWVMYRIIDQYRHAVNQEPVYRRQVGWLFQLWAGVVVVYGLALLPILAQLILTERSRAMFYPLGVASSLFLAWAGVRAFLVHERFTPKPSGETISVRHLSSQNSLYQQALRLLEDEQLYKQPSLKLTDLADRLSVSPHHLSRIMNQQANKNFNDLVNEFRITEVTRMMHDPAFSHFTLEGLGREAGFGAKSTYQASFKRLTGLTPSQYRANHRPIS